MIFLGRGGDYLIDFFNLLESCKMFYENSFYYYFENVRYFV